VTSDSERSARREGHALARAIGQGGRWRRPPALALRLLKIFSQIDMAHQRAIRGGDTLSSPHSTPARRQAAQEDALTKATLVAALLAVLSGLPRTASAAAPITVGDGTAASCTEAALRDALIVAGAEGGGTIRFQCGADPVTITVSATLTVPNRILSNPALVLGQRAMHTFGRPHQPKGEE